MANPNKQYEKLVTEIHQAMLKHDGFENLKVEHDTIIVGKSGARHQIDVFWEFKAAGVTYRTCVECKNYKRRVEKSHVAAFATIIEDIGNANGIIATTVNYQKGALLIAKDKNIRLVLVNYLLNSLHLTMLPKALDITISQIHFDEEYAKTLLEKASLSSFTLDANYPSDQPLLNKEGEPVETFDTLIRKNSIKEGHNKVDVSDLYVESEIGNLRIKGFSCDMNCRDLPPLESHIQISESKAVLEEIVDKNKFYLNNDGSIIAE